MTEARGNPESQMKRDGHLMSRGSNMRSVIADLAAKPVTVVKRVVLTSNNFITGHVAQDKYV
jgi:hypothetical protein